MNNNQRYFYYSPFKRLKVSVSDIDYDFDGLEDDEIEQVKSSLSTSRTLNYTADELFNEGVLSKDKETGIIWILDRDALEELISGRITDDTDFCHNGFNFRFSLVS